MYECVLTSTTLGGNMTTRWPNVEKSVLTDYIDDEGQYGQYTRIASLICLH